MIPRGVTTLGSLLRWRASEHPDRTAYIFLPDGQNEHLRLSYAEVDRRARAVAARLQRYGAAGQRALIAYPQTAGAEYITAFLGCLYAGAVAVPCDAAQPGASTERLLWIARDARPRFVLQPADAPALAPGAAGGHATSEVAGGRRSPGDLPDEPIRLDVAAVPDEEAGQWRQPRLGSDQLALLQYTSGSTRGPRGVMVSHGNILANERAIALACQHDQDSCFVGWLPMFHDMGMIANVLQPLYLGSHAVLMPPAAFLARPACWLAAISRYRGVTAGGPSFGFELCVRRVAAEDLAGLDLSSWRVAFNGAEIVRPATLHRFTAMYAPVGFAPETYFPCYGLAEATLIVAGGRRGIRPRTFAADPAALRHGRMVPAPADGPGRTLVSNGPAVADTQVMIVDPDTRTEHPDGMIGEVWVSGPGVGQGYWQRPEESRETFAAQLAGPAPGTTPAGRHFLRTGDIGARHDGELYLAGRLKDVIIVRGQNHYPDDLEWTAERGHPALRPSCGAAFSIDDGGEERLVIVYEIGGRQGQPDIEQIAAAVRRAVSEQHHVEVHTVAAARRGSVAKTTSGKVRRRAVRAAYLAGTLPVLGVSTQASPEPQATLLPELAALAPADRLAALASALVAAVAARTGARPDLLDVDTPLSAAGLDSLAATELQHRLQERYRVHLAPLALLGDTSAIALAAELLRRSPSIAATSEPATVRSAEPAAVRSAEPAATASAEGALTATQRALWFEYELAPPGPAYTLVRAVRLRGPLVVEALNRAVAAVVARHPALRTRFVMREGEPVQVVTDGAQVDLQHEPLDERGADDDSGEAVRARLAVEAARSFDLTQQPPVRLTLLRRSARDHVLVFAVHHLVADFWSLVIVVRELLSRYRSEVDGPPAQLPALPTSVIEQAAPPAPAEEERLWAYWRRRLADAPAALDLPLDRPRPPVRRFRGAAQPVQLGRRLTARLRQLSLDQRTTLVTTILTAYQLLLSRHASQRDVVVGLLTSGRDRAELAGVVGCFVNPVPSRLVLDGSESFRSLLLRNRVTVRDDLAHGGYPFARLVSRLDPPRVPGQPALIQAMLVFQQEHGERDDGLRALALGLDGGMRAAGLTVESLPVRQPWTHLDLTLNLAEIGGALTGSLEYDTALFDASTVAALADRFRHLLNQLVDAADRPVGQLSVLATAEYAAALAAAEGPKPPRPTRSSLYRLIRQRAATCPDATAVVMPGQAGGTVHLSYRALCRWADQLAGRLATAGVGPESIVGVLLDRSAALPVALLAALRRGAAYLPLDPGDPPERLAWLLRDAGVEVVLTCGRLAERLPPQDLTVLDVAATGAPLPTPVRPEQPVHPEQAAYIMYTSGSTGRPKGVVVPHRAIVNRLMWMQEALGLKPTDRVVHKAPTTFDVSMWELAWPLAEGACLVLAPPGSHRDPPALVDLLRREQVTTGHFVPSLLAAFLAGKGSAELPALTRMLCSGESLPARLRDQVGRQLQVSLYNLYGPTEAAVDVTAWRCPPGESGPVPIGAPIAHVQVHVLESGLTPAPTAVRGEIHIGGTALARGYLARPALTAATFVPDPLGSAAGARLYRTGDFARRRRDGAIAYLGRADHQVKIAGNRIELGEVEQAIRSLPVVRQAAAAVTDDGGGPRLVGYLVAADPANPPDPAAVRRQLRRRLPAAMVPAQVVLLPDLPITANGKLDRRALAVAPAPVQPAPAGSLTAHQRLIADHWADVLTADTVSADADFFAVGGDSILALRLVARLRESGIPVTVADLVAGATVRGLAALPVAGEDGERDTADCAEPAPFGLCPPGVRGLLPQGLVDAYPVSQTQQAVLFQQLHNPAHEVYVTSLRVRARFDPAALRTAIETALQRHPYLRSSFDLRLHREPLQLVHEWLPSPLAEVDLRHHPPAERERLLADWLRRERKRPIEVTAGPLVRFCVHRCAESEFQLSLSSFALDGWCSATVLTELLVDYHNRVRGMTGQISPPRIGYGSFVALEQAAAHSPVQRQFWDRELADAPACVLPRTGAARSPSEGLTRRRVVAIEPELTAALRRLARTLGVPLKSVLLAAHLRVVRLLTGQPTVLTGLEVNGRPEQRDGDRVVGVFNNIVPLRVSLPGGSWIDLVRAAAAAERRITPYRRYPLSQLERDHRVRARFDTLFVYTHFHLYREVARLPGLELVEGEAPDTTYVPLTAHFNVDAVAGGLRLLLDYDPAEVGDDLTAAASYYHRALASIAADPDRPAGSESLLGAEELVAIRRAGTRREPARARDTVPGMILRQVARTPDAVAVVDQEQHLSYRALAARSARLAATLRAGGAGPEALVALPAARRAETVVSLLAILLTGAAYLPVEPEQPPGWLGRARLRLGDGALVDWPDPEPAAVGPLALPGTGATVPPRLHPTSLAYALLTSGSTGEPKLVGVSHAAVVNYLHWCAEEYGPAPGSRTPVHSPLGFDLTVTSLLAPLVTGGTVTLLPPGAPTQTLGQTLAAGADGLLKITPAHFAAVGQQLRLRQWRASLSCAVVGGEQLTRRDLEPWVELVHAGRVVNEYGPTEATVGCCSYRPSPDDTGDPVPIGRPIAGATGYVLDDGQPVPTGVTAELYVGGVGLARGYLGEPGLTAARFVPDPFGVGARLYRTGDLAWLGDDGLLRWQGRRDRQLKIRGHRVEPAAIEHELGRHPDIRQVAVAAVPAAAGQPRLLAYWVPMAGRPAPGSDQLTNWLSGRLPAHLLPDGYVRLPALPLTARGKVDYAALPDPATTSRERLLGLAERLSDETARELLGERGGI